MAAANIDPRYSAVGDCQWGAALTAANTAKDGTGTVTTICTADATNGGRFERIKVRALGTNVATVMRFFINNGSTNTTATNNALISELTCPATTLSEVAALADLEATLFMPIVLPPGYRILCTIGTAVAAGLQPCAIGGKF